MSTRRLSVALSVVALVFATWLGCGGDDERPGVTVDAAADSLSSDIDARGEDSGGLEDSSLPLGPVANIYPINPVDTPELESVTLRHLAAGDGSLVGDFARVRSCVPDLETGQKIPIQLGNGTLEITVCTPTHQVKAGGDGTYRQIVPPATPEDDDGRFAELMMYHHMQQVHDYFKDVHGLTNRDEPLDAVVNLQAHIDLCDEWARLPNAAFMPHEALDQLPLGISLDLDIPGDAIVFSGTDTKNFAFDASVIYHEYTHAILGATRLNGAFIDDQGINNLPGALNEAYADYFASTLTGISAVGHYSLNDLGESLICGLSLGGGGGDLARDLSTAHTCPADLTAEVHADSEIFSGALWEIRTELGALDADRVILDGVLALTNSSDFTSAAEATVDAASALLGPDAAATVQRAFDDRGIVDCARVLPIERVGARGLAVALPAPSDLGADNPFGYFAPGYLQYSIDLPAGVKTLVLTLQLGDGGLLGGLMGGGGGGTVELEAAFKRGSEPIRYVLGTESVRFDSEVVVPMDTDAKTITVSGACLSEGRWTFALHSRGAAASLEAITLSTSSELTADVNFDSCGD